MRVNSKKESLFLFPTLSLAGLDDCCNGKSEKTEHPSAGEEARQEASKRAPVSI